MASTTPNDDYLHYNYTPSLNTQGRGRIYNDLSETIGNTPLVRVPKFCREHNVPEILVKLELFNPLSSVKDRLAYALVESIEKQGLLTPETELVEPTSGNTGIALAFICAAKGYKLHLFMPETMSLERRKMLKLLGAKLTLTPASGGMTAAVKAAEAYVKETPGALVLQQFRNHANAAIHRSTTAHEIWNDTEGKVDVLIAGIGTGGTITGCSQVLKSLKPSLITIGVEPEGSPVLTQGKAGPHQIQGIGAGFVPEVLDRSLLDEVVTVANQASFDRAREIARLEGIPVGISSGAVLEAAIKVASRPEMKGKTIVAILASGAERYMSTALFNGLE